MSGCKERAKERHSERGSDRVESGRFQVLSMRFSPGHFAYFPFWANFSNVTGVSLSLCVSFPRICHLICYSRFVLIVIVDYIMIQLKLCQDLMPLQIKSPRQQQAGRKENVYRERYNKSGYFRGRASRKATSSPCHPPTVCSPTSYTSVSGCDLRLYRLIISCFGGVLLTLYFLLLTIFLIIIKSVSQSPKSHSTRRKDVTL
ncbi:hypothetical protein BP00DRAFT_102671 [Aspergillus indologenus CBS 114.80]|uniref:Uncharacterized protein n=1 Tax=Aspergillus indologenus CBS 114.80 TaxID=1450541 RepID=A0A2V5HNJ9_9EURO|nr:hypothetical protein BP00DRAFT_102671 [Aspergillus indologenus CBS 114.80]